MIKLEINVYNKANNIEDKIKLNNVIENKVNKNKLKICLIKGR